MGYGGKQVKDLEATIAATPCDAVIIGTPIDLRRIIKIKQPSTRVGLRSAGNRLADPDELLDRICRQDEEGPQEVGQ